MGREKQGRGDKEIQQFMKQTNELIPRIEI